MGNRLPFSASRELSARIPVVNDQQAENLILVSPTFGTGASRQVNAVAVLQGTTRYCELSQGGNLSLYKQQITGMDMSTLNSVVTTVLRDWKFSIEDFEGFEKLVRSIQTEGRWPFTEDLEEQLKSNKQETGHLYFRIQRTKEKSRQPKSRAQSATSSLAARNLAAAYDLPDPATVTNYKYNLVLMYLSSDEPVDLNVLLGGMMSEGLLARDSNHQIYMQL